MVDPDLVFKAMGDPTRIQILRMIAENGEMCVCKITEELELTQSSISHHLSALRNAGLVSVRRKGQWSHYSLRTETLNEVVIGFASDLIGKLSARTSAGGDGSACRESRCSEQKSEEIPATLEATHA